MHKIGPFFSILAEKSLKGAVERMGPYVTHSEESIYRTTLQWLKERGVTTDDIAPLVYQLQNKFYQDLTIEECRKSVEQVLRKREVQNAILTGIEIDRLAEHKQFAEPLQEMLWKDEGIYGIDEVLATAIIHVYGSIGFTNFGYIDRVKPGILQKLNNHSGKHVHTFLDDLVGAVAAAAAARLAHHHKEKQDAARG